MNRASLREFQVDIPQRDPVHEEKTLNGSGAVEEIFESKLRGQEESTLFLLQFGTPHANLKAKDFSAESLLKF